MPPRIPALPSLGSLNLCLRPASKSVTPNFLPIVQTANLSQREKKRKAKQDPYRWAQAQQRKAANVQRREELSRERDESWGDAVLGKKTPFIESLATAGVRDTEGQSVTDNGIRNYFLSDTEVEAATKHAYQLTEPMIGAVESQIEPETKEDATKRHNENHEKVIEALSRITSLENGSSKDRFHANVQRIINEFGRHRTDSIFMPNKPPKTMLGEEMPGRLGPDTGSSEVQIAILTAKIHNLSNALQINRGYKDKHNKRNLRLLLHRRQKLMKYMDRKERGSQRWAHMVETLGLTPATWKDQISL